MIDQKICDNIQSVLEEIRNSEKKSGRNSGSVKLCAVSKFHPKESVLAAIESSQMLFGENRIQEAFSKFSEINEIMKSSGKNLPSLHIIGSLQTNKVKKAIEISECIQSADRTELLLEVEKQCAKLDRKIKIFFELHTAEDSKSGYASGDDVVKEASNFMEGKYPHVIPAGLMTMAPFTDNEFLVHKSFESLRNLKERLNKEFPSLDISELSMGMSGDYKIAIEEGSTMVRIGTAIFGERTY